MPSESLRQSKKCAETGLRMNALRNAAIDFLGTFIPWWLVVGVMAYLAAWVVTMLLERLHLTRHIWHLPLFFVALVVLFFSVIGLILAP
jgi:dolichyl-phosphate-mannose--protein O-mannosyl transferase